MVANGTSEFVQRIKIFLEVLGNASDWEKRRDGEIGRHASFRCWWGQPRGGSSPLLGTNLWRCFKSVLNAFRDHAYSVVRMQAFKVLHPNQEILNFGLFVQARFETTPGIFAEHGILTV